MGRTTYAPHAPSTATEAPESVATVMGAGFALSAAGIDAADTANRLGPLSDRTRPSATVDLDHRLSTFIGSLRWAAISLGLLAVAIRTPPRPLSVIAGLALATFGVAQTLRPVRL